MLENSSTIRQDLEKKLNLILEKAIVPIWKAMDEELLISTKDYKLQLEKTLKIKLLKNSEASKIEDMVSGFKQIALTDPTLWKTWEEFMKQLTSGWLDWVVTNEYNQLKALEVANDKNKEDIAYLLSTYEIGVYYNKLISSLFDKLSQDTVRIDQDAKTVYSFIRYWFKSFYVWQTISNILKIDTLGWSLGSAIKFDKDLLLSKDQWKLYKWQLCVAIRCLEDCIVSLIDVYKKLDPSDKMLNEMWLTQPDLDLQIKKLNSIIVSINKLTKIHNSLLMNSEHDKLINNQFWEEILEQLTFR